MAGTLHTIRGWRGAVTLTVDIGRIWITHSELRQYASDPRSMPWADKSVLAAKLGGMKEGGRRIVDMSKLVTGEAGDAQFLVNMKLFGQDHGFWGKTPRWTVEYLFSCVDPRVMDGGEGEEEEGKFVVSVDAESFKWHCQTEERCLGETWVHCLKRVWDFRIRASGTKELGGMYAGVAGEIVESLYIP